MNSLAPSLDDDALRATRGGFERALLAVGPRTELILVRHGLQQRSRTEELRPLGPRLSETGKRQAAAAANLLAGSNISALYCSDITRAHDTARAIGDRHPDSLEPEVRSDLREIDIYGESGNRIPPVEVQTRSSEDFYRTRSWDSFPDTESSSHFRERMVRAVSAIAEKHINERVVVVAHGGAISTLLAAILGIEEDMWFYSAHTGITTLLRGDGRWAVRSVNETAHLVPDLLTF